MSSGINHLASNIVASILGAIVEHTTIDDQLIDAAVAKIKEAIPGDNIEPILGKILIQMGNKLINPTD